MAEGLGLCLAPLTKYIFGKRSQKLHKGSYQNFLILSNLDGFTYYLSNVLTLVIECSCNFDKCRVIVLGNRLINCSLSIWYRLILLLILKSYQFSFNNFGKKLFYVADNCFKNFTPELCFWYIELLFNLIFNNMDLYIFITFHFVQPVLVDM